jgi:hypothetical protein
MSVTALFVLAFASATIIMLFVGIMEELEEQRRVDTKVEPRDPPKFSGVTLSSSIPHGALVKVIIPNDPTFRSPWDGLTGVVVGVDELHEWYNVMFPLEGRMKFQIFRRHDLEKIDRV